MTSIKVITEKEIDLLLENGVLKHSHKGYINQHGQSVGFYRCKGAGQKRYIEDKYQEIASKLMNVTYKSK